jgi:hypothetical protein
MGLFVRGKLVNLPWNDDFEQHLMKISETTYQHSGDDLLHEIHKTAIEANWINIRFYRNIMRMLWVILAACLVVVLRVFS